MGQTIMVKVFQCAMNTFLTQLANLCPERKYSLFPSAETAGCMITAHTSPLVLPDFWAVKALATSVNTCLKASDGSFWY
jgi:hypothetical protein